MFLPDHCIFPILIPAKLCPISLFAYGKFSTPIFMVFGLFAGLPECLKSAGFFQKLPDLPHRPHHFPFWLPANTAHLKPDSAGIHPSNEPVA